MGFLDQILDTRAQDESKSMGKEFISNVFSYMFLGLSLTALVAYYTSTSEAILTTMYSANGMTTMGYIITFAPLGLAIWMQAQFRKFSVPMLVGLFMLYAALLGMSLGPIFLIYSMGSIATTFGVTALTFGAMALLGYTTSTDLTKFGSIMYMAFIGIFIAGLVNFFMESETMSYVISGIGILVFTGLTAVKLQELKYMGSNPDYAGEDRKKLSIIGGLVLYILFINLFLSLLRFMGRD